MINTIRNLVLFKAGWLACVIFAAAGNAPMAALSALAVAALHLVWAPVPRKEALLLTVAATIGLLWESFMVASGLAVYPEHASTFLAPYWIVAMWVLFATTINHGMRWMKRNLWVAALAGLAGGPMAFYGGMKLGAVSFPDALIAFPVIAAGWAVLLPIVVVIADSIIDMEWLEPRRPKERSKSGKRESLVVGFE